MPLERSSTGFEQVFSILFSDVINGYVIVCEQRRDLFSEDDVKIIFANLDQIAKFQQDFLKDLQEIIERGM